MSPRDPAPLSNPEDEAEDGASHPEDIPRIHRRYNLSPEGRARLVDLGRSRWAAREVAKRREAELDLREAEIAESGPEFLGMHQCSDCSGWFENSDELAEHRRSTHPVDLKVSDELGVSRRKVNDVWVEACRKQERHPEQTPGQIVRRFWGEQDRQVLDRLLAYGAAFRFRTEE